MDIRLREYLDSDAKDLREVTIGSDQRYMRYPKDESYTIDDALEYIRSTRSGDTRAFAICLDDEIVGNIYVNLQDKASIGCFIHKDCVNMGIGTIATKLMIDICFDRIHLDEVRAYVVSDNVASIHVLEKIGFCVESVMQGLPFGCEHINLNVMKLSRENYAK